MKKLTLAAAIAAMATSFASTAATIYENEKLTYKIKGDIQIQLLQDVGEDEKADVNYDDSELKNSVTYDLGNDMKAFAQVDFDFKKESSEETYVGLAFGKNKVWIGDTDLPTDDFGVEENIDVMDLDGDAFPEDASDEQIGASFVVGNADIKVAYDLESADDELSGFDAVAIVPVGPVEIGAAYQALSEGGVDTDTYGASISGEFAGISLGLALSTSEEDGVAETDNTHFVISTAGFTVGYDITDVDAEINANDSEVKSWYANYVYKFPAAKNVSLFAEVGDNDADNQDMGYLLGMRVKF